MSQTTELVVVFLVAFIAAVLWGDSWSFWRCMTYAGAWTAGLKLQFWLNELKQRKDGQNVS